jgi:hypothetical protein
LLPFCSGSFVFLPAVKEHEHQLYKTIILSIVLYGCETWSFTLREEQRLRVFENRVPRRILGPERGEATGELRKLHSGELRNFYSSRNISRQIKSRRTSWVGHVAHMGEERKMYKVLAGRSDGKRRLGKLRHRWEEAIKMDLGEIGWEGVVWIQLPQGRDLWWAVVNTVMNL